MPKKVNLAEESAASNKRVKKEENQITDAILIELCPAELLKRFKAAKSAAARADLLYNVTHEELKALRQAFKQMDDFVTKLEGWFVQEFVNDATGVTGKVGRVEVKNKEIAVVEDWEKFYANLAKKKEFDLLNRALNQKAVTARWEEKKQVPGVGKFTKQVISLTGVKK